MLFYKLMAITHLTSHVNFLGAAATEAASPYGTCSPFDTAEMICNVLRIASRRSSTTAGTSVAENVGCGLDV